MPDVAVVVIDARDHVFHGIDLIGPHDHEFLLAGDEHHVAADGAAEVALFQESVGEGVETGELPVFLVGIFIDGQETLIGIEGEVASVVFGEVKGAVAIADDEELHEAEQRLGVAVAGIVLVFDDLLHGVAWADAEGLELDDFGLSHGGDSDKDGVGVSLACSIDSAGFWKGKIVTAESFAKTRRRGYCSPHLPIGPSGGKASFPYSFQRFPRGRMGNSLGRIVAILGSGVASRGIKLGSLGSGVASRGSERGSRGIRCDNGYRQMDRQAESGLWTVRNDRQIVWFCSVKLHFTWRSQAVRDDYFGNSAY